MLGVEVGTVKTRMHRAVNELRDIFHRILFYREGWGRFYSDDALHGEGLEAVDRAISLAPSERLVVEEPGQEIRTADELKAELERGLRVDASDLNPTRVFRPRK
jgi:hypothetical protein